MAYKANSIFGKIKSSMKNDPEKKEQDPIQGPKTKEEAMRALDGTDDPSIRAQVSRELTIPEGEGQAYVRPDGSEGIFDEEAEEFIGSLRGNELKNIAEYEGADTPEEREKAYKTLSKKPNYDGKWENEYEGWQTEEGVVTDYWTAYRDRNRDAYGHMNYDDYVQEAKRQKQEFIDTGDWDAPQGRSRDDYDSPSDKLVNSLSLIHI